MMDITTAQPIDTLRAMLTDVLIGFVLGAQVATNLTLILGLLLVVGFAMASGLLGDWDTWQSGNGCERGVVKSTNGNGLKMKLRDFMVNSLPRVRSRKKQKQLLLQQQQQQQQHANRSRLLNNGDLDENRNTYTSSQNGFSEKDEFHYRDPSPFRHVSSESIRSELEELKIEKSRFADNVNSVNLNVITNSADNKCMCFKRLTSSYGPNDVILGLGLSHCTDEDGPFTFDHLKQTYSFNTVPKARSKIRTNPWCTPSPKSTPTGSPASSPSPNSSSSNSPSLSPTESRLLRSCDSPAVSEMSTESYSSGSASSGNENVTISACAFEERTSVSKVYCVKPRRNITSGTTSAKNDFSKPDTQNRTDSTTADVTTFNIKNAQNAEDETDLKSDKKTPVDDLLDLGVSFEYEEVLESLLEDGRAKHGSFASIKDLYEEELGDSFSDCSLGSTGSASIGNDIPLFADQGDFDNGVTKVSILGRKSPLCYSLDTDYPGMNFLGTSEDEEEFAFFRSGECLSDSASSANGDALSLQSSGRVEVTPEPAGSGDNCRSEPECSGRSLGDVKASLEEKVLKLREEKMLVDEKIREAQEEDRIRVREKVRFQKQLTLHRKQILLKTLKELKEKLEQQGTRLQESYSAILNVQKRFAQKSTGLDVLPKKVISVGMGSE